MKIKRYQQGGPMPAGAPEAGAQQDPIAMIAQIFAEGLQAQDCSLLAQGAEAFLQLVGQAMGGAPQGPAGEVPEGTEPVFKKGGKMVRRRKCGSK